MTEFFSTLFVLKRPSGENPVWFASVGGVIVELTTDELSSRRSFFRARFLAGALPSDIANTDRDWQRFVDRRLRGDLVEIKAPGMTFSQTLSAVRAFNYAQLRRFVIDGPSAQYSRVLFVHEVPL